MLLNTYVRVAVGVLQSDPEWYFEPQGVSYWMTQLFNTPLEVHAFVLGVTIGALFAQLVAHEYPKAAAATLLFALGFSFGLIDIPLLCSTRTAACAHLLLKLWYFFAGALVSHATVRGIESLRTGSTSEPGSDGHQTGSGVPEPDAPRHDG